MRELDSPAKSNWPQFFLLMLALIFTSVFFIIDVSVPGEIATANLYLLIILYTWLLRGRRWSLYFAILCTVLIVLKYVVAEESGNNGAIPEINRLISCIGIWVCATLVSIAKSSYASLENIKLTLEAKVKDQTQALRESEQLYRYLYEQAHELYVSIDPKTKKIINCNQTICRVLEYKKEEIIGRPLIELYHPDCLDQVKEAFATFIETGFVRNKELILLTRSNKKIDVLLNASAVRDAEGNILYSRSSFFDITSRKRADTKFKNLLESAPDAIIISDDQGKIQLVNTQAEKLFGYTRNELLNNPVEFLIPQRFMGKHPSYRADYLRHPKTRAMGSSRELFVMHKDGTEFPVEISLSPLETEEGQLVSAAVRDITKRKQVELSLRKMATLESKRKEMEQFAYITSHDLREPLLTVINYLETFDKKFGTNLDAQASHFIHASIRASYRMENLIKGLLDYSRLSRAKSLNNVDCNQILEQVKEDLGSMIQTTSATIEYDQLPVIRAYALEFKILIQNLIQNAIKFRKPDHPPVIRIRYEEIEGGWQFSVQDNGIGIRKRDHEKVFIIFRKLEIEGNNEGMGMGLANSKKIVELHNGTIWLESEPEEGSTFHFKILTKAYDQNT